RSSGRSEKAQRHSGHRDTETQRLADADVNSLPFLFRHEHQGPGRPRCYSFSLTNSMVPLSLDPVRSVVPVILSPSTFSSHVSNATVRPGRGCVVRVMWFPFKTPSSGCWLRSSAPIEPAISSPDCLSKATPVTVSPPSEIVTFHRP